MNPIVTTSWKTRLSVVICLLALVSTGLADDDIPTAELIGQVGRHIQSLVSLKSSESGFVCRGEPICGIQLIPAFYAQRQYQPVWLDDQGLRPTTLALMRAIARAGDDGLNRTDYHFGAIQETRAVIAAARPPIEGLTAEQWAEFDIVLTDAFLLLCSHLSGGRVNPETLHSDWVLSEPTVDIMEVLHTVVTEAQLDRAIDQLRPLHSGYANLRAQLGTLREIEANGGWPQIPEGETLRPDDRNARVLALRHRLLADGDLLPAVPSETPDHFDDELFAAVKRFQNRHGLDEDGQVGRLTLEALNTTIGQRIRQIELNLERWRWLPDNLGDHYISVNTADFSLLVVENKQEVLKMPVVVGKPARRTPVFSSQMSYMVVNPDWTVPFTIAVEDMLPEAVSDPDYFDRIGIRVFYGWDEKASPINPRYIDWRAYGVNNFPFRFVQAPGPSNVLGRFKFMFPNKFAVYLHDTPYRGQFDRVKRDFSSGCIRVSDAVALAEYLIKDDPAWSVQKLRATLRRGRPEVIHIQQPIWVHLLYMTAWVNQEGVLQFRRDIYERDVDLDKALAGRLPRSISFTAQVPLSGSF